MKTDFSDTSDIADYFNQKTESLEYPKCVSKPSRQDYSSHTSYGIALDEYETKKEEHRILVKQYREKVNEINKQFKAELLSFLEISDHKNAEKLYSMAWEDGHSNGLREVAFIAENLSELLS